MQIDRKNLDALLSLNDRQLMSIIGKLISESGIDPAQFNINPSDIASIRTAISGASDEDLCRVVEQYEANKRGNHGGRR